MGDMELTTVSQLGDDFWNSVDYHSDMEDSDEFEVLDLAIGVMPNLQLPESIYTAAMILPAAFDGKEYCDGLSGVKKTFILLQVYILFMANCIIQFGFSWYVRQMWIGQTEEENCHWASCAYDGRTYGDKAEVCGYATDRILKTMCLLIYGAIVLGDMCETMWMGTWLYYTPRNQDGIQKLKYGGKTNRLKNGLSRGTKGMGFLIVLGAKMTVGCLLILYGGGFVLGSTEKGDLLMNALAVAFVIDLDEIMYDFMLPRNIRNFVEEVNSIKVVPKKALAKCFTSFNSRCGMFMNAGFLATITFVTYNYFCRGTDSTFDCDAPHLISDELCFTTDD